MAEELTFHLEDFDGPLELLLALVAKHKMDLHNIPILELIDQYTRTVEQADPDPETASAFIEMAAHLVEMKSYLLLPRSEEGERMKQEFTGQLIEYDQCRRMAALLRAKGEQAPVFVRQPMEMEWDNTYTLHHAPQILADYWNALAGRTRLRREPTQQQFEPPACSVRVSRRPSCARRPFRFWLHSRCTGRSAKRLREPGSNNRPWRWCWRRSSCPSPVRSRRSAARRSGP